LRVVGQNTSNEDAEPSSCDNCDQASSVDWQNKKSKNKNQNRIDNRKKNIVASISPCPFPFIYFLVSLFAV
jgi:hypothetical protein